MRSLIPFTYYWHVRRLLGSEIKSILDLGCGEGEFGDMFNVENKFQITGVDVFQPYLDICKKNGRYLRLIKSDLNEINFRARSFDAVVCFQTIEHLKKKDALKLISKIEKIARKVVLISTPVGHCEQDSYDGNKYQRHLSSWNPDEFIKKSFSVTGIGLKLVYGNHSHALKKITVFDWVPYLFSFLLNPITAIFPKIAAQMIAVKYIDGYGPISFNILPFSYSWIFKRKMGKVKRVLDVGCGEGRIMSVINHKREYTVTGVDLYKPYLDYARELGVYHRLIQNDIRMNKFKHQSFDVVISSQVIEHLKKKEALDLIKEMERTARKRVVLGTTNGYFPYDPYLRKDDNPLQIHKSGWGINELHALGYKVYGQGLSIVYKPGGLAYRYPKFGVLFFAVSYLFSPLTYFFPKISAYLIAVKNVK